MAMLKIKLTNDTSEKVEFPKAEDIDWTEEGAFIIFRGNKGQTVGYNKDVVVRFDVTENWGK